MVVGNPFGNGNSTHHEELQPTSRNYNQAAAQIAGRLQNTAYLARFQGKSAAAFAVSEGAFGMA
jgi:hypothetical protein